MHSTKLPWGDNWWIENDKAWFCGGEVGALFSVDLNSLQCKLETWIPECVAMCFRLYSYCIKYKSVIFCLPCIGECIWCYDIDKDSWEKIEVGNKGQVLMCIDTYEKDSGRLWFIDDAAEVFEVNLKKRMIENRYAILQQDNKDLGRYVIVDEKFYCVVDSRIYCIDNNCIDVYEIPITDAGLYTISYDGRFFWLSGHRKEIYIWTPEQGIVKVISEFPKQFGFYHFDPNEVPYLDKESFYSGEMSFFLYSVISDKHIWYVPHRSNGIIYIDRETYKVSLLEMEEEVETKESVDTHLMRYKFLIEYIRANRYIGIYSLKNQAMFEIDTLELCVNQKNFKLSSQTFFTLAKASGEYTGRNIFWEGREKDKILFKAVLSSFDEKEESSYCDIGKLIYHSVSD